MIAILAAITIVAYNGIQERAQTSKIQADMQSLEKAINAARIASNSVALRYITINSATGSPCWSKADGTDLAALPDTDSCWGNYRTTLSRISNASGINVNNLVDPWGRPYYIDENEGEGANPPTACNQDAIGYYSRPFTTGQTMTKVKYIQKIQPACL